jgi:hypothetical protein
MGQVVTGQQSVTPNTQASQALAVMVSPQQMSAPRGMTEMRPSDAGEYEGKRRADTTSNFTKIK